MESEEKRAWKARYSEAENLIMTLDGRDEQKDHENRMLKKELARVRKELEEKDDFFASHCGSASDLDSEYYPVTP